MFSWCSVHSSAFWSCTGPEHLSAAAWACSSIPGLNATPPTMHSHMDSDCRLPHSEVLRANATQVRVHIQQLVPTCAVSLKLNTTTPGATRLTLSSTQIACNATIGHQGVFGISCEDLSSLQGQQHFCVCL